MGHLDGPVGENKSWIPNNTKNLNLKLLDLWTAASDTAWKIFSLKIDGILKKFIAVLQRFSVTDNINLISVGREIWKLIKFVLSEVRNSVTTHPNIDHMQCNPINPDIFYVVFIADTFNRHVF